MSSSHTLPENEEVVSKAGFMRGKGVHIVAFLVAYFQRERTAEKAPKAAWPPASLRLRLGPIQRQV